MSAKDGTRGTGRFGEHASPGCREEHIFSSERSGYRVYPTGETNAQQTGIACRPGMSGSGL